jgi:hypothetical protein
LSYTSLSIFSDEAKVRRKDINTEYLSRLIEYRVQKYLEAAQPQHKRLNMFLPKIFAGKVIDSIWKEIQEISSKDNQHIDGSVYNRAPISDIIDLNTLVFIPYTSQTPADIGQEKGAPQKIQI